MGYKYAIMDVSAINHAVNYRSAILFVKAQKVTGLDVKEAELNRVVQMTIRTIWSIRFVRVSCPWG